MHHVTTLDHVTRRAINVCNLCNCEVCKSHAQSLEDLLREPADTDKLLDAIVLPHRSLGLHAAKDSHRGEVHDHVVSLVLNLALAWSFAIRKPDDDSVSSVIEHLRDAWWSLMAYEAKVLIEDAPASPRHGPRRTGTGVP